MGGNKKTEALEMEILEAGRERNRREHESDV